jgi:cobalt-zinc-cadmium resistance protein CzcA
MKRYIIIVWSTMLGSSGFTQSSETLTIEKAVQIAFENHPSLISAKLEVQREETLKKSAVDFEKTEATYRRGQINSPAIDYEWDITQGIKFPTTYVSQSKLQQQKILLSENALNITATELEKQVRSSWFQMAYEEQRYQLIDSLESLYSAFAEVAEKRYLAGETNILEKTSALGQFQQVQLIKIQAVADVIKARNQLLQWLGTDLSFVLPENVLQNPEIQLPDSAVISENASLKYFNQVISVFEQQQKVANAAFLPDLYAGYFNQQIDGVRGFSGFKVGIRIPLFFWADQGKAQAANLNAQIAKTKYDNYLRLTTTEYLNKIQELSKFREQVIWYNERGKQTSDELLRFANKGFQLGEIDYLMYINSIEQAITIKTEYLLALNLYHQTIIEINYLTGNFN